jgi:hypothetical protein
MHVGLIFTNFSVYESSRRKESGGRTGGTASADDASARQTHDVHDAYRFYLLFNYQQINMDQCTMYMRFLSGFLHYTNSAA